MARKKNTAQMERPASLDAVQAAKLLRMQYDKGKKMLLSRPISEADENAWITSTHEALSNAFGSHAPNVNTFASVGQWDGMYENGNETIWEGYRAKRTGERLKIVEGMIELLESKAQILAQPGVVKPVEVGLGNGVFLVHGHNEAILHEAARFLESLDLETFVLREQPNEGRTIIEKFIDYSNVGFAVVLLTGDDRGGVFSANFEEQKPRARQNVILELGFFLGKLGRKRVCALCQRGVEIPSDYSGVAFIELDNTGAWKAVGCSRNESGRTPG